MCSRFLCAGPVPAQARWTLRHHLQVHTLAVQVGLAHLPDPPTRGERWPPGHLENSSKEVATVCFSWPEMRGSEVSRLSTTFSPGPTSPTPYHHENLVNSSGLRRRFISDREKFARMRRLARSSALLKASCICCSSWKVTSLTLGETARAERR